MKPLTEQCQRERRRAKDHPLVAATISAEKEIRAKYPWKKDWLVAINATVALLGLSHDRRFAEAVGFGLRHRMGLYEDRSCSRGFLTGCLCVEKPCHDGQHRCACGRKWGGRWMASAG